MNRKRNPAPPSGDSAKQLAVEPSKPNPRKRKKPSPSAAELTTFEKYEIVEIHRSELKNAPYNPRRISAKAKDRLRKNIQRVGLLDPVIWNRITGNIVGGHQRVDCLDALEGTRNYKVRVSAVELDPEVEKTQNVFLNNEEAQGTWDLEKLEALFSKDKINYEDAGYSMADLYQMFGDSPFMDRPDDLSAMAEKIRAAKEEYDNLEDKIREDTRDEVDYYAVVVFESDEERTQFTDTLDTKDNRFIDGRELWAKLHANHYVAPDGQLPDAEAYRDDDYEFTEGDRTELKCTRMDIDDCPRCRGKHLQMVIYPLANPVDGESFWSFCPRASQPMLLSAGTNEA